MKTKAIFTFTSIIYLIRAVGLLLSPDKLYGTYGVTLDPVGLWSARFMGGPMLFIALVNWSARNGENSSQRSIVLANIVLGILSILLSCTGAKLFNSLVWAAVGLDAVLLLSFAYLFLSGTERKTA